MCGNSPDNPSKRDVNIEIQSMTEADVDEAVALIATAMNVDEAAWARETMAYYFKCKQNDIDSGREYFVWRHDGRVRGGVGLHRYLWGPRENVWLSWFAVHPELQGMNVGSMLLSAIEKRAREAGFKKFLVETYDSPDFEKAVAFYKARGFSLSGEIKKYLPDGSPMLVFSKSI